MEKKSSARNWKIVVMLLAGAFIISLGASVSIVSIYVSRYDTAIFPGVSVGAYALGGKTREQALAILSDGIRSVNDQGVIVSYHDRAIAFPPVNVAPFDPDISQEVFRLSPEQSIEYAWNIGRRGDWPVRLFEKARAVLFGKEVPLQYTLNKDVLLGVLQENFGDVENPARDAKLAFAKDRIVIDVTPEQSGWVFDREQFVQDFKTAIASTSFGPIQLLVKDDIPRITANDITPLLPDLERKLNIPALTLRFEKSSWSVPQKVFRTWVDFAPSDSSQTSQSDPQLSISADAFREYASQTLEKTIKIAPEEPRFEIDPTTHSLKRISQGRAGRDIDNEATVSAIKQAVFVDGSTVVEIKIQQALPRTGDTSLNDLGIQEIIGTGHSNMKGSPKNRRHNIARGALSLHGILIPPGEQFSLLKTLGDINAKTGYLPELVIKGNKTIPEYGGGLCQIGTTTFRATLKSGLPVLERQNHSYQVPYYIDEKGRPGTDATIYDPAPDYRFLNDTGNFILIQTRIVGDDIYFDFWGTKDGRSVYQSETKVWGIVKPPPTKIIETTDLAPGEKKCTERPHNGANAEFTYEITYPLGEKKTQVFTSHYRPWQEVCLVGVEKETDLIPGNDASKPSASGDEIQSPEDPQESTVQP